MLSATCGRRQGELIKLQSGRSGARHEVTESHGRYISLPRGLMVNLWPSRPLGHPKTGANHQGVASFRCMRRAKRVNKIAKRVRRDTRPTRGREGRRPRTRRKGRYMSLDGEFIAVRERKRERERERERAEAASLYSGDFYQQRHFIKITNGMGYHIRETAFPIT